MTIFLQVFTILTMLGVTYLIFNAFGAPKKKLLFTQEEKKEWDELMGRKFGGWFTVTNILGTLTSLATVYIFFLGSSKLFGGWTFLCSLTIWGGAYATNFFTRRICADPTVAALLASHTQTGGVIASLFWRNDSRSILTARIVKWISLLNILSVIWLDFALFADISGSLIGHPGLATRTILLASCCFAVVFFTLKYGLRGFVFADFFQSPLILLASLVLLGGAVALAFNGSGGIVLWSSLFSPMLPLRDCLLFTLQVISLNFLLVLVTEPHWLRVWIFRNKETDLQAASTAATGLLWGILVVIGLFAFSLSGNKVGEPAIIGLLGNLSVLSPAFLVAFWIGGMAALFASADTQIYSLLIVNGFNTKTGQLEESRIGSVRPLRQTIVITGIFCLVYLVIRGANVPFEKMIFIVLPVCLNIFPAFVLAALGAKQHPAIIGLSLLLYATCSVLGFIQSADQFSWTLIAPLCPVAVSLLIVVVHLFRRAK